MILWLISFIVLGWTILFRYKRRNMYKLAAPIKPPKENLPFIGVAHKLAGNTEEIMKSLQDFSYAAIENNGIIKGWLGHILYFLVTDPVDLEIILKTCMEKDDLHRFIRKVIGNGAIFAPVSIWRKRRKVLVPVFSPKIVENFVEVFSEQSERLAQKLLQTAGEQKLSIWPYISSYTLDSVSESAMGVTINAQGNPNSPFLISMNRILNLICERIFHLWLQPDWIFRLFPQSKEHEKCLQAMQNFTDTVIKKKRKDLLTEKSNKPEVDNEFDLGTYKRKSFLDLLISLSGREKGYTNVELREEVLTLTVAGTDTSACAIGFTLKLLGKYPEVQEKIYQELRDVFGDMERPLIKEDLIKLKYLERVVKESLRLYPPVPFVIRKVLEDIKLPSGRVLPAGSGIVVSIWGVHRDPKHWGPDAEHFDPDRFLPECYNLKHPCSYMPFSSGPRNCVGYQYALMSVKTSLASILRRFKVVGEPEGGPIPKIRVKLDIMMKAVDGYEVMLEQRNVV
ncbi:hypothetical protein K1T71_004610 [Dendrolimus kikuchii]|uniref:Uncharacterized protein n=1 Tax=Dendrolimus kikuchii TaxID=765133 RepID=A0ACC1D7S8_9NEOP|nr:hypothetical protein K1T71_004610 [Dendrolimus kikuchii]